MEGIGLIAAVVFLVVFIALAMIVLTMIRRTVKLAFRLVIVAVLLLIAASGATALWWFSGSGDKERPAPVRRAR